MYVVTEDRAALVRGRSKHKNVGTTTNSRAVVRVISITHSFMYIANEAKWVPFVLGRTKHMLYNHAAVTYV